MHDTATHTATNTATNTAALALDVVIDTNLAAYGNQDAASRQAQLAAVWAADGKLIDPPIDGAGLDGIDQMMAAVQGQFPGHTFRRSSAIDAHHGVARYSWELVNPEGAVALVGLDVAEVADDGKLARVLGFMGELQPA
ncbi:MAG: nuclear transport factor 2 family protein [Ilumatobacteraceae bacterium]